MNKPKPGSAKARAMGCRCPVLDNHRGKGRYGDGLADSPLLMSRELARDLIAAQARIAELELYHDVASRQLSEYEATIARAKALSVDWRYTETTRHPCSQYGDLPSCSEDLEAALAESVKGGE
jgi:hypothetical protein